MNEKNLRFPTRPDHWLFQDGCQIAVSTDVGLTVHNYLEFAENKYCFNLVSFWIFLFMLACPYMSSCGITLKMQNIHLQIQGKGMPEA